MRPLPIALAAVCAAALLTTPGQAHAAKAPAEPWDLNGDGRQDLVYPVVKAGLSAALTVRYSGSGRKQTVHQDSPGVRSLPSKLWTSTPAASADFDEDGYADLAFAGLRGVSFLYGSKKGLSKRVGWRLGWADGSLVVGDFNGNGRLDVAVAKNTTILVHFDIGRGRQQAPTTLTWPNYIYQGMRAGDFDGDGHTDLTVRRYAAAPAHVSSGGPAGLGTPSPLTGRFDHDTAEVGDFDGDGRDDLLAVGSDSDDHRELRIHFGPLTGGRTQKVLGYPGVDDSSWRSDAAVGDLNRDGYDDLLYLDLATKQTISLFLGSKSGLKAAQKVTPRPKIPGKRRPDLSAELRDLSGDGRAELVVTVTYFLKNVEKRQILVYRNVKGRISASGVKTYKVA